MKGRLKRSGMKKQQPLLGRRGRPLRLWDAEGRPATDIDGCPLSLLGGRLLVSWDPVRGTLRDLAGRPLRDACNRSPGEPGFDPEASAPAPPVASLAARYVAADAHLLTDMNRRPLTDPNGQIFLKPGLDRPTTDAHGKQVFEVESDDDDMELIEPLWLWDEEGRPLTDVDGRLLKDLFGRRLIEFNDSGKINDRTLYGASVVDARHRRTTHRDFNPKTPLPKSHDRSAKAIAAFKELVSERRLVFDCQGMPLTSSDGEPLSSPDGTPLLSTVTGDLIEISLSHYDPVQIRLFLSQRLLPIRLFDPQGRPVTSPLGEPLCHADGRLLVLVDTHGQPISGLGGLEVYDEFGTPLGDPLCRPDEPLASAPVLVRAAPKIFDIDGLPLTDRRGYAMLTADRQPLLTQAPPDNLSCFLDRRGRQVYSESGLPLVRSLDWALVGARGRPCRLFDTKGMPLTDSQGVPLKSLVGGYSLTLDAMGFIIGDARGGVIYDALGTPISWSTKFNSCRSVPKRVNDPRAYKGNKDGRQLFDGRGLPMTGTKGEPLTTADGKSLILLDAEDGVLRQRDGRPVFDLCGRPQRGIVPSNPPGAAGDCASPAPHQMEVYQLFDSELMPVFDSEEGVRKSEEGRPLVQFDKDGRVASDGRGRDVFDPRGIPLTRVSGAWRGPRGQPVRLFDEDGRPLTDSQGRPLSDAAGRSLVREDQIGRPLFSLDGLAARDSNGRTYINADFCPLEGPQNPGPVLRESDNGPLIAFDAKGRPLSDDSGAILASADGTALLSGPLRRLRTKDGGRAFDARGIPLGCSPGEVLASPTGAPLRLFSRAGAPLTCPKGCTLRFANDLPVLVFDMLGRPLQDAEGGPVCDMHGISLGATGCRPDLGPTMTLPVMLQTNGRPLRLFDADGRPLTGVDGRPLPRADGTFIRVCPLGKPQAAPDGGPLFNQYGSRVSLK